MSAYSLPFNATETLELFRPLLGGLYDPLKAFVTKWRKDSNRNRARPNLRHYMKVSSVNEVIQVVKKAKIEKKRIRVIGAGHSAAQTIYSERGVTLSLAGELRRVHMKRKEVVDGQEYLVVRAGAGCYLGVNPLDPDSNQNNSLNYQVEAEGFAFPILGGISYQSVAGFMMTSSAGGSVKYGFSDVIQDIEFVDGNGRTQVAHRGTDLWCAVGVSMGLLGIITHVTFRIPKTYFVKVEETNFPLGSSSLLHHGKNKGGLEDSLKANEYFRANWLPQKYVNRVGEWSAKRVQSCPKIIPYKQILADPVTAVNVAKILMICNRLLQVYKGNDTVYRLIGNLLSQFVPLNQTGHFCDSWRSTLPMDDKLNFTIIKTSFTEIWLPLNQSTKVMRRLQKMFVDQNIAGNFATEIYGGKKSPFWLSMSYEEDSVRVNPYWWVYNIGDIRKYFTPFWNTLLELPGARLHWGKWLPKPGQKCGSITFNKEFLKKSFPKFEEWLNIREKMDPYQVFLTEYWRSILEIPRNKGESNIKSVESTRHSS